MLAYVPEPVAENRVGLEEMGPDGEVVIFFSFCHGFSFLCGLSHGWDSEEGVLSPLRSGRRAGRVCSPNGEPSKD